MPRAAPSPRRAGRFERELCLGIPSETARAAIFATLANRLRLEPGFDGAWVAKATPGYVGGDFEALVREAIYTAVKRFAIAADGSRGEGGGA